MKLYVARHGQTQANVEHLFNGRNQRDLTDIGIEQAKELSNKIKELDINYIYCSPLKRTIHTAEILNINNLKIIQDDRLIERDYKELTLKPVSLVPDRTKWYDKEIQELDEVECFKSIISRVTNFIDEIKNNYKNENILVVTHGDILVAFQEIFDKKTEEYPKTGTIFEFEI